MKKNAVIRILAASALSLGVFSAHAQQVVLKVHHFQIVLQLW